MKQISWNEDSLEGVAQSLGALESDLAPHAMRLRRVMLQAMIAQLPAGVCEELSRIAACIDRITDEAGSLAGQVRAVNDCFAQEERLITASFRPHTALDILRNTTNFIIGRSHNAIEAYPTFSPSVLPLPKLQYTERAELPLSTHEEWF